MNKVIYLRDEQDSGFGQDGEDSLYIGEEIDLDCDVLDNVIYLRDFLDLDGFLDDESDLPDVEDLLDDPEALHRFGEDAFLPLLNGLNHRKQMVRLRCVVQISKLFPSQSVWDAFRKILMDRNESGDIRFHVARHSGVFSDHLLKDVINDCINSKGCNDRIVAAILMGWSTTSNYTFHLLNLLSDSNNCVVIAAFLMLLKQGRTSLLPVLKRTVENASPLQLKLLEKNIKYYEASAYYPDVVQELMRSRRLQKVCYLPQVFEKPYSQEKLSKLDRPRCVIADTAEQDDLIFYEI